ncbi:outer membrane protein assembly factor BamB family protein [Candidatus Laterigemmans baculatus]|uniref:outer membrane protein assembly factor BamB family protein n=1 Tax=Candidatus Laterigemmans baculatus TaxID=2770505 RepID=UPI0013DD1BF0|nr:PQQ-binding-like beta-propeller repeat protein [Candidatus Laterigemmans baculatus]
MLVRELIDRLETGGLLDQEIIEALRQQLEESGARVTPEAVAKLLVDNGHLTRFQATKLIGELRSSGFSEGGGDERAAEAASSQGELSLADEAAAPKGGPPTAMVLDDDEADELAADDAEFAEAAIIDEEAGDDELVEAEPWDEGEEIAEAEAIEEGEAVEDMASLAPHPVVPVGDRRKSHKNVWDSIWIYGTVGVIAVLLATGAALYYVLDRTSSEEFIARADGLYSQQNFPKAQEVYRDFLDAYGDVDEKSSMAKVRIGLSDIFIAKQSASDPTQALVKAQEILPTIENEPAFEDERTDVAGLLVDIGSQIAQKADSLTVADDKQATLGQLDELLALMQNPLYVSTSLRQTLGPRIAGIEETRARVQRDINRDRDLAEAIAAIESALKAQETKKAYDVRTSLVRRYPRLRDDARLSELVLEASRIQQSLVKPLESLPAVSREPVAGSEFRSVLLANRTGSGVPELADRVVYIRARGSVLALAADDGRVLWRRFVGYENDNAPLPLGESAADGVLLSDGRDGELQRIAENEVQWRSQIGEPFTQAVVDDETIYTSTTSGRLLALDAESGEAKWGRQIPQPLEVSPGKSDRGGHLFLPAEHSNLYVLESGDGQCLQSYYIGHEAGTIRVPPVPLLGHLFVIENAGSDYALVHILRVDEQTGKVERAQGNFRLTGNVTVSPEVQGRRLIVLTDRGQVAVFDVEPSAERDKVSRVAEQVATYDRPTETQMTVGRNQMWVTGTRIGRFELQINTGKVVRDWVRHEGDRFIAKPILMGQTLIHARQLRGTQGVRITASRPEDAQMLWQTDVGVPTAMITADRATQSIYAITSQAALYHLDSEALENETTAGPVENPGGAGVAMRFEDPLDADNGRYILTNQESAEQIVLFDPARSSEKLRLVTLSMPPGNSEADPILVAGGLLMPLDTGRIVLMNWQTGMPLGSPFQPPAKPGEKVRWTTPVTSPADPDQVLIGDSRGMLYRLRAGEQVRELSSKEVTHQFVGPAAAIQGSWMAAVTGAAGDTLVTFSTTSLEESHQRMMGGRIVFGPVAVGDAVLLQTEDGKLRRVDQAAEEMWSLQLPGGQPVATPQIVDGRLLVAGAEGWLVAIDPSSGEETGRVEIGQPLSGNPLPLGSRLLVPGSEGIVFIVEMP